MFGGDRNRIAGLKPSDELATRYVGNGDALVVDDRVSEKTNVAPEIVACMFPEAGFHDVLIRFFRDEMALGDYVFAPQIVVPKNMEGDEANLAKGGEVGPTKRVSGLYFALGSLVNS